MQQEQIRVLFVCAHNSARSQMAEAFLQKYGGPFFHVESAGIEPGTLNSIVVRAMHEIGIDISDNKTNSVFDFVNEGRMYHYVITVCDESQSEECPVFPSLKEKIHWGFADPSQFQGTDGEKLIQTRLVRDAIEKRIREWVVAFDGVG